MKTRTFAAILVIAMLLFMDASVSKADMYPGDHKAFIHTGPIDLTGKTVILHSNDVHGALEGYADMAGLRKQYEAMGAEVILVDVGDFTQGSGYVYLSKGHSAIDMMNAVGYDLAVIGNHDIDYGFETMMANLADANFPVLCANIFTNKNHERILPATHIIETATGMKLGFFGIDTPEVLNRLDVGLFSDLEVSTTEEMYDYAQDAIDSLQGVDLVIGLVHLGVSDSAVASGNSSIDLWNNVTGADLLIDGHSHTVMTQGPNGEPIQSSGKGISHIGVIVIDNATKRIEKRYLMDSKQIQKDESVSSQAQEIISEVDAVYNTEFATTEISFNGAHDPNPLYEETCLGDLIAEAFAWYTKKEFDSIADVNESVVGIANSSVVYERIDAGGITINDTKRLNHFGNTLAVVYVTGAELLEALEASTFRTPEPIYDYPQTYGIEWTLDTTVPYDPGAPYTLNGKTSAYRAPASIGRVTITSVCGRPFDEEAVYAVATNSYVISAGDTYNTFGRAFYNGDGFATGIPLDEAIVAFIKEVLGGKITAEAYGKPSGALTQILAETSVSTPAA